MGAVLRHLVLKSDVGNELGGNSALICVIVSILQLDYGAATPPKTFGLRRGRCHHSVERVRTFFTYSSPGVAANAELALQARPTRVAYPHDSPLAWCHPAEFDEAVQQGGSEGPREVGALLAPVKAVAS